MSGSRTSRVGIALVGAAAGLALLLATAPVWLEAVLRRDFVDDPYADTYYVVFHFDWAWIGVAVCLGLGVTLLLVPRRHD